MKNDTIKFLIRNHDALIDLLVHAITTRQPLIGMPVIVQTFESELVQKRITSLPFKPKDLWVIKTTGDTVGYDCHNVKPGIQIAPNPFLIKAKKIAKPVE